MNINVNTLNLITLDPYWQQIGIIVIFVLGAWTRNDLMHDVIFNP